MCNRENTQRKISRSLWPWRHYLTVASDWSTDDGSIDWSIDRSIDRLIDWLTVTRRRTETVSNRDGHALQPTGKVHWSAARGQQPASRCSSCWGRICRHESNSSCCLRFYSIHSIFHIYCTGWSEKNWHHFCTPYNFTKSEPIFRILSLSRSWVNS